MPKSKKLEQPKNYSKLFAGRLYNEKKHCYFTGVVLANQYNEFKLIIDDMPTWTGSFQKLTMLIIMKLTEGTKQYDAEFAKWAANHPFMGLGSTNEQIPISAFQMVTMLKNIMPIESDYLHPFDTIKR